MQTPTSESLRPAIRLGLAGALACLAVTTTPYVYGFLATPSARVFIGLGLSPAR